MPKMVSIRNQKLRSLPSVDLIARSLRGDKDLEEIPSWLVLNRTKEIITSIRNGYMNNSLREIPSNASIKKRIIENVKRFYKRKIRRLVNATGVIIHTNLGRAPMGELAAREMVENLSSYTNLEYDLKSGKRGSRNDHLSETLRTLTGAEDCLLVNNNAAAQVVCACTLANKKEIIVSRGEIVEIGGGFRINEIIRAAGAKLREIGTTNKTRLKDYETAICDKSGFILKVHTSNFRIVGYQTSTVLKDIVKLSRKYDLPCVWDAGSGLLVPLEKYGIKGEMTIGEAIKDGVDIVTFSGDKLLGGPQCGIIVGKRKYVEKLKKHPLARALRVSKFTLDLLESTLVPYLRGTFNADIPVLKMISSKIAEVKSRANSLCESLINLDKHKDFEIKVKKENSFIGGGSYPQEAIPTFVVSIKSKFKTSKVERYFRESKVPVIARIKNEELLLDLRTIFDNDFKVICEAFQHVEKCLKEKE